MLNNYYSQHLKFIVLQKRFLPKAILAISLIGFLYSCTKLDTTVLGSDLLTVDNINTFADTLEVVTTQGTFDNFTGPNYDSTIISKGDLHALGNASSIDFGKTDASIYVQFKPPFFPFYFGNAGDTVKGFSNAKLDSVVLLLSYSTTWGDSTSSALPQTIQLKSIVDPFFKNHPDTLFGLRYFPNVDPTVLASAVITPQSLKQFSYFNKPGTVKDSVSGVLRFKLPATFANQLYLQDSSSNVSVTNNGFLNDSIFRTKYNGFQIKAMPSTIGNSLYFFNLIDGKTRLEFHFSRRSAAGVRDSVMSAFYVQPVANFFNGIKSPSSIANDVKRDYAGSSIFNGSTTTNAYLQAAPGTFVNVSIPKLTKWRNKMDKIVHRAFLQIDQSNPTAIPSKFTPPAFVYADLKDSIIPNRFKPVYFDLSSSVGYNPDATFLNPLYHPFPSSNVELGNFGGNALTRVDGGVPFTRYEINFTRYVQHIIANNYYNYDLRVFAPFNYFYRQYQGSQYLIPYAPIIANGEVRVGAGSLPTINSPDPAPAVLQGLPRRMKMIVIYSLVK